MKLEVDFWKISIIIIVASFLFPGSIPSIITVVAWLVFLFGLIATLVVFIIVAMILR